jgi:hypothetical protein
MQLSRHNLNQRALVLILDVLGIPVEVNQHAPQAPFLENQVL